MSFTYSTSALDFGQLIADNFNNIYTNKQKIKFPNEIKQFNALISSFKNTKK